MGRIVTIDDARGLVGKTFTKDGKNRRVVEIAYSLVGDWPHRIVWHGDDGARIGSRISKFNDWLEGASEVINDRS